MDILNFLKLFSQYNFNLDCSLLLCLNRTVVTLVLEYKKHSLREILDQFKRIRKDWRNEFFFNLKKGLPFRSRHVFSKLLMCKGTFLPVGTLFNCVPNVTNKSLETWLKFMWLRKKMPCNWFSLGNKSHENSKKLS